MATIRGIAIGDVTNTLESENIVGTEKLPVSSGQTVPQVTTTGELKEYINEEPMDAVGGIVARLDGMEEVEKLTNADIDSLLT